MQAIKFELSGIDIDTLIEFEEGDLNSMRFIRDFLGRFISNGKKGVLPPEEGAKKIGKVKLPEIKALTERFTDDLNKVTADLVNPQSETSSEKPSEEPDEVPSG